MAFRLLSGRSCRCRSSRSCYILPSLPLPLPLPPGCRRRYRGRQCRFVRYAVAPPLPLPLSAQSSLPLAAAFLAALPGNVLTGGSSFRPVLSAILFAIDSGRVCMYIRVFPSITTWCVSCYFDSPRTSLLSFPIAGPPAGALPSPAGFDQDAVRSSATQPGSSAGQQFRVEARSQARIGLCRWY